MPKPKRISYFDDPIAYEMEQRERNDYLANLFYPIDRFALDVPIEWLVHGFIPKGYLVVLAADPKEGKSCLATALALAVACGTPFAGIPTEQRGVLWLSLEEGPQERRLLLGKSALADPAIPLYTSDVSRNRETLRESFRRIRNDQSSQFFSRFQAGDLF